MDTESSPTTLKFHLGKTSILLNSNPYGMVFLWKQNVPVFLSRDRPAGSPVAPRSRRKKTRLQLSASARKLKAKAAALNKGLMGVRGQPPLITWVQTFPLPEKNQKILLSETVHFVFICMLPTFHYWVLIPNFKTGTCHWRTRKS